MNKYEKANVIEELQKVLTVLIDENHWCKRSLAQDAEGNPLYNPWSKDAMKYCIYGAMYALDCSPQTHKYLNLMCKMYTPFGDLNRLNDLNEHYYVIQFLQFCLNSLGGWFKLTKPLYYLTIRSLKSE